MKIRVLDGLGCAIATLEGEPIRLIRDRTEAPGPKAKSALIGEWNSAPNSAAFCNGALVRYLDFSDSYLASGETCHPNNNLAPVLAAAEFAGRSDRESLTSLAVAP